MFNGEPILPGPYDPVTQQAQLIAARAAMSDSSDDDSGLLAVPIAAADALVGADADHSDGDTDSPDISAAGDDADTSTPLGEAQPFEYSEDMPDGDAEERAGSEGMPRNNQAQNKQTNDVAWVLRLTPDPAQQLHYEIQGEGLGYHQIMERAKDKFNLW